MSNQSSSRGHHGSTTRDMSLSYSTSFHDQNTKQIHTPVDSLSRRSQDPPMAGFEINNDEMYSPSSLESNSRRNHSIVKVVGLEIELEYYFEKLLARSREVDNDNQNRVILLEEEVKKLKSEKEELEGLYKELQTQYCESKKQTKSFLRDLADSKIAGDIRSKSSKLLMDDIQNCQSVITKVGAMLAELSSTSQYDSEKLIVAFENWKN